jgi:hypothetical protein
MTIPLPNLDDRRWADLVEEGRNLIPRYAPEWTDFNVHDPGITLLELFAWVAEIDIFRLNRIPESHRRKFLALLGITLQPPQASQTVVQFSLRNGSLGSLPVVDGMNLPATTEVETASAERPVRFRTLQPVTVVAAQLASVWREQDHVLLNLTELWRSHEPLPMFSDIPKSGSAFYVGLSEPLPEGVTVTLYLGFGGGKSGLHERRRLQEEWFASRQDCGPPPNFCRPEPVSPPVTAPMNLPHHSARTVWEVGVSPDDKTSWRTLDAEKEVVDETRACTLDGFVRVTLPAHSSPPGLDGRYYYLRCRLVSGEYDAPPTLQAAFLNAALVEQAVPVSTEFIIAKNASVSGPVPQPGSLAKFTLRINAAGEITTLVFLSAESDAPEFFIARLTLPTGYAKGSFVAEMQLVDRGLGEPLQEIILRPAPVQSSSLQIFTLKDNVWNTWTLRPDFDASARTDRHFLLDATNGTVTFGDGEHGLPVPRDVFIIAKFHTTEAERGNVLEQRITRLSFSAHNQGLLDDIAILDSRIAVSNPFPAATGAAAETLEHAEGRALEEVNRVTRAITVADIEYLARTTPGTIVARVAVKPNLDVRYPCLQAPGTTSVIILPRVAVPGAQPSSGLRAVVQRYLDRRRIIGNRIEVVGPAYTKVTVRARVQTQVGASPARVGEDIREALQNFLDPLYGGPEKTGWPFGRDVYRSEILQTIDGVDGVENVVSLDLIADDGAPSCGNLCIQPCGLVISGEHLITVE